MQKLAYPTERADAYAALALSFLNAACATLHPACPVPEFSDNLSEKYKNTIVLHAGADAGERHGKGVPTIYLLAASPAAPCREGGGERLPPSLLLPYPGASIASIDQTDRWPLSASFCSLAKFYTQGE